MKLGAAAYRQIMRKVVTKIHGMGKSEDGGSVFLYNFGIHLQISLAGQLRRQQSGQSAA
jgi:hypothetical protein